MKSKYLFIFVVFAAIACLVGCPSSQGLKGLVPAVGTVTYQNAPAEGASLTFIPVDKTGDARTASAVTDATGKFSIKTLSYSGIYPGEYNVMIMKTEDNSENSKEDIDSGKATKPPVKHLLPQKYASASTSGIKVTIPPKGDQAIVINLE